MRIIRKKQIKLLKLFLLSPILDQATQIIYLISFLILYIQFLFIPSYFSNFTVTEQISETFDEKEFRKINTFKNYSDYFNKTIYKLYDIKKFPLFLPLGSIKLKTYALDDQCTTFTDESSCAIKYLEYSNNSNLYLCPDSEASETIPILNTTKKYDPTFYDMFIPLLVGNLSNYDLLNEGNEYHMTIEDHLNRTNLVMSILSKKKTRCKI